MSLQLSVGARNGALDAIVTELGASPIMEFRTGAPPANVAAARTGSVVSTLDLPSTAFNSASSGAITKAGTWQDASADADGTAGHWCLYKNDGTTCVAQGTVTASGGGGDVEVDNVVFAAGQQFTISSFEIDAGNA